MALGELTAVGGGTVVREIDADEIRRAVKILADPALSFQIQGLKSGRHQILRGDNETLTEKYATEFSSDQGVYYSINPCAPGREQPVVAAEMCHRRWLLFDVDPVRPKPDLNATDAEKEDARFVCSRIRVYLRGLGWPAPVAIDSGNGWHLLYRIELPNDDASRDLVRSILHAVAERADTDRAKVDRNVFNANRIAKLPGTWAKKGPHSPERPHRMARLVEVPGELVAVSRELLEQVVPPTFAPRAAVSVSEDTPDPFVVEAGSERAYLKAALEKAAEHVRDAVPGGQGGEGRNNALNKEAYALGGLLGEGRLDEDEIRDALTKAATDAGLEAREIERTLDSGIKSGKKKPREREPREREADDGGREKANKPPPVIWTMPQILATEFPPPRWAVHNLLSEGLTILAGKPKLGKSWIALNLALTIAAGGTALGYTKVPAGDVLYLSLEDRLRRVQDRARKVLSGMTDVAASERLCVAVEAPRLDAGGLDFLQKWLESVPRPTLVIADVWAKFRSASKGNRPLYDQDYEAISKFKEKCDSFGCSGMAVHHTKKGKAEDAIEEVSGTLGLAGAADGVLVLTRSRSETEAELFVTGRDVEEQQLALEFDPKTFVWKLLGAASERTESKLKGAAILILKANAGIVLGTGEIADRMGLKDEQRHYLRTLLGRMTEQGLIEKAGVGRYRWPVEAPDSERFR